MPDISMCLNQNCSIRKQCYRFTAQPSSIIQSYSAFLEENKESCYIPNKKFDNDKAVNPWHKMNKDVTNAQREIIQGYYIRISKERPSIEEILNWLEDDLQEIRMDDLVNEAESIISEPDTHHDVSIVICDLCGCEWVAVRPTGVTKLQCPNCDKLSTFTIKEF